MVDTVEGFAAALGRTIKVARTDLGIERRELATRSSISYSYLAAIENGSKQPSAQVLLSIADALGVRSHQLLASAEMRHDRNWATDPEVSPIWLAGTAVGRIGREALDADQSPERTDGTAELMKRLGGLVGRMGSREKRLLLELAETLAD
jgi:transcriptional regulator with XRE-family HTH domain